jgi:hypothetical protein
VPLSWLLSERISKPNLPLYAGAIPRMFLA